MKIKTSITLSEDLLQEIERESAPGQTRSEFIELAVRSLIAQRKRARQNARDLEIINRRAHYLNEEAEDALDYQADL